MSTKTLHNSDASPASKNVSDLKVYGNPDCWKLITKASSQGEGWMKSTKAMEVPGGVVIQVTTQQLNLDGTYSLAEALTFVPNAWVETTFINGVDQHQIISSLQ